MRPSAPTALHAWLLELPEDQAFTVDDPVTHLNLAPTTVHRLLRAWTPLAVSVKSGTGCRGNPKQYLRAASMPDLEAALAVVKVEQSKPCKPSRGPRSDRPRQLSIPAQVIGALKDEPARQWTVEELAQHTGRSDTFVARVLTRFVRSSIVTACPGNGACRYVLTPPAPPAELPAPVVPVPPSLSFDERTVFEALRREPSGLPRRLLGARLNWSDSRTERVTAALESFGHITEDEGRLRVAAPVGTVVVMERRVGVY